MRAFTHSGKMGDVIFSLPTIQSMGGGALFLREGDGFGLAEMKSLLPLLTIQPGLAVGLSEPSVYERVVYLDRFRDFVRGDGGNLATAHLWALGQAGLETRPSVNPWLSLPGIDVNPWDRVIFSRRKTVPGYPGFWTEAMERFHDRAIFIGSDEEYSDFCKEIGFVTRKLCRDTLDIAIELETARLFVGSQSLVHAIAEALKKPVIQECHTAYFTTFFDRPGAVYVKGPEDWSRADELVRTVL